MAPRPPGPSHYAQFGGPQQQAFSAAESTVPQRPQAPRLSPFRPSAGASSSSLPLFGASAASGSSASSISSSSQPVLQPALPPFATSFGAQSTGYGAPSTGYGAPSTGYGAPLTSFGMPTTISRVRYSVYLDWPVLRQFSPWTPSPQLTPSAVIKGPKHPISPLGLAEEVLQSH